MFGKRTALFLFCGILGVMPALAGCVGVPVAQMEEYKAEGIAQMEAGEYGEAAETFQTALDESVGLIGDEEVDISYYKALALYMAGDPEGALEVYTALIDFGEDGWETYCLRGELYAKEGFEREAVSDFSEAASRNPDDPELCMHICVSLFEAGLFEEAAPYIDTALSFEAETGEEYYDLGVIRYMSGDEAGAKSSLEQARAMGEDEAFLLLGRVYAWEGDRERARELYSSYAAGHPEDAESLAQLGAYAVEEGEYEEAADYLTAALGNAEGELLRSIVINLVAAYEYGGDFESAYETAGVYLAEHEDEELAREYEFLATRIGALPEDLT